MVTTQDHYSQTLSLMYEIKSKDVYEDFSKDKKMCDFSNYSAKSKYYDDSNKLVLGKMKDETAGAVMEEFTGLKPKIHSFLEDDSSEHKKAKGVNKNDVATISQNEYKDVLLNNKEANKVLFEMMNRNQIKNYKIGTYEINDDKIYIQKNGYDGLALGY